MQRVKHRWAFFLAVVLLVCFASATARAGTLHCSTNGFSTSLLNVLTNEPITFIADDNGNYAVLSYNWAAGTIYLPNAGSTGTVTLRFSGIYNIEDGRGHYGIIYVNIPPTCKITNPTNNAVFTAPASFDFSVHATNTDQDQLLGVDFWLDENYLDGRLRHQQPFTVPVTNLGPGIHTLRAVAVDYGEAATTDTVTITVLAPQIILAAPAIVAGNFQFNVTGVTSGKSIVLQSATSVTAPISWLSLGTNVAGASSISFTNPVTAGAHFFRAVQLP